MHSTQHIQMRVLRINTVDIIIIVIIATPFCRTLSVVNVMLHQSTFTTYTHSKKSTKQNVCFDRVLPRKDFSFWLGGNISRN